MKRCLAGWIILLVLTVFSVACALTYSHDPTTGFYVDESGNPVSEYWDDAAGIYIVDGVAYPIENADNNTGNGGSAPAAPPPSGSTPVQNPDGSITVPSADQTGSDTSAAAAADQENNGPPAGSAGLTHEEWKARMEKAIRANGAGTETFYVNENGEGLPVEVVHMGLGRSEILLNGEQWLVPTSSLVWETEAPEDKMLAVVTPTRQTYVTIRAKMSKKAFVMEHCEKCRVVRVISTGKTWTMVDHNGLRGYVLTSGLTFYPNEPREFSTGVITFRGKTASNNTVHIRSSNKNTARQLEEFPCGTALTIFDHDEKWCEVDVGGWHCYILSEFVTFDEPAVSASGQMTEP